MKKMIKIIRKRDVVKEALKLAELEQDYLLGSLFAAMQSGDDGEKEKFKIELAETTQRIENLKGDLR